MDWETAFALSLFRPGSFCWRNTLDFSRLRMLPALSTTHGKTTSRLISMPPMKVLFTELASYSTSDLEHYSRFEPQCTRELCIERQADGLAHPTLSSIQHVFTVV
ncbi:hypothetical protein D9613_011787 [Agrocybe pediades]|uniref:Uncharacterized protein n=1 Tax=Agrocybe pediades TaxID=84607 RepID=A0A8H4QL64_9AGAR|nr:hypothetical protein D9613_011787 [Agrocybe pediades]